MSAIRMTRVTSKAVSEIGYNPATKVLHVRFSSGHLYSYPDIEPHEHAALVGAESIGKHLNKHFREKGVPVE
jgi:hypothetical protein